MHGGKLLFVFRFCLFFFYFFLHLKDQYPLDDLDMFNASCIKACLCYSDHYVLL